MAVNQAVRDPFVRLERCQSRLQAESLAKFRKSRTKSATIFGFINKEISNEQG